MLGVDPRKSVVSNGWLKHLKHGHEVEKQAFCYSSLVVWHKIDLMLIGLLSQRTLKLQQHSLDQTQSLPPDTPVGSSQTGPTRDHPRQPNSHLHENGHRPMYGCRGP